MKKVIFLKSFNGLHLDWCVFFGNNESKFPSREERAALGQIIELRQQSVSLLEKAQKGGHKKAVQSLAAAKASLAKALTKKAEADQKAEKDKEISELAEELYDS